MPCYSPLKGYKDTTTGGIVFKQSNKAYFPMEVACGQCLGCRLDRSRMWASRIVHEASLYEHKAGNSFITLTYDDEHLPGYGCLVKEHFQKFMKKLRWHVRPRRVRYYMCGEYGTAEDGTLGRPHYHAILFNQQFSRDDIVCVNNDVPSYSSEFLSSLWKQGFAVHGEVSYQSAAYVARYCMKKVTGAKADDYYTRVDPDTGEVYWIEPEYSAMSRRPGIGSEWYERYKSDFFPRDETPVPGRGVHPGTPRYYMEKLREVDPDVYDDVKQRREVFITENKDDYTPERLMDRYKVKKAAISNLKRTLE